MIQRIELPNGYFIEVRNNGETCAIVKPDGEWLNGVFNIKKAKYFAAAMKPPVSHSCALDAALKRIAELEVILQNKTAS